MRHTYYVSDMKFSIDYSQEPTMSTKTPWRTLWRFLGDGLLLRKLGTSKLIQSFLYTRFLTWNLPLTTVKNQACPLKTPLRVLWKHLRVGILLRKLDTPSPPDDPLSRCFIFPVFHCPGVPMSQCTGVLVSHCPGDPVSQYPGVMG